MDCLWLWARVYDAPGHQTNAGQSLRSKACLTLRVTDTYNGEPGQLVLVYNMMIAHLGYGVVNSGSAPQLTAAN